MKSADKTIKLSTLYFATTFFCYLEKTKYSMRKNLKTQKVKRSLLNSIMPNGLCVSFSGFSTSSLFFFNTILFSFSSVAANKFDK